MTSCLGAFIPLKTSNDSLTDFPWESPLSVVHVITTTRSQQSKSVQMKCQINPKEQEKDSYPATEQLTVMFFVQILNASIITFSIRCCVVEGYDSQWDELQLEEVSPTRRASAWVGVPIPPYFHGKNRISILTSNESWNDSHDLHHSSLESFNLLIDLRVGLRVQVNVGPSVRS